MQSRCNLPRPSLIDRHLAHLRVLAVAATGAFVLACGTCAASDERSVSAAYLGPGRHHRSGALIAQAGSEEVAPAPGHYRRGRASKVAGFDSSQRLKRADFAGEQTGPLSGAPEFAPHGPGGFGPDAGPVGGPGAGRRPGRFGVGARMGGRQLFGGALDLTPLALSDEQKQRIRDLRSQSALKAREVRKALQARRAEMRALMFDPNASDRQIRAKRQELRQMQDQLEDLIISDFLSVRAVLTPEQRKRLPEVRPGAQAQAPAGAAGQFGLAPGGRFGGPAGRFAGPAGRFGGPGSFAGPGGRFGGPGSFAGPGGGINAPPDNWPPPPPGGPGDVPLD